MLHKSLYVPVYASNTVVKRDYENCCPHGSLFIYKARKCGEVRMLMTPFVESRAPTNLNMNQQGKDHSAAFKKSPINLYLYFSFNICGLKHSLCEYVRLKSCEVVSVIMNSKYYVRNFVFLLVLKFTEFIRTA